MKKKLLLLFAVFLCFSSRAQQMSLSKGEQRVGVLFQQLTKEIPDSSKQLINDSIHHFLGILLKRESSFDYPFPKLNFVGKRISHDKKVAIYTWCYPTSSGELMFNGFIQHKRKRVINVFALKTKQEPYVPEDDKIIHAENWYGSLYFNIIPFNSKQGKVYILLGWAQNKPFITMKTIDVLCFDKEGVHFGAPVFEVWKKEYINRVVLEYNADASITLEYEKDEKRFVFDHLSPINSSFEGDFKYYTSNSSYDAYKKNILKKRWVFHQNVKAGMK